MNDGTTLLKRTAKKLTTIADIVQLKIGKQSDGTIKLGKKYETFDWETLEKIIFDKLIKMVWLSVSSMIPGLFFYLLE